MVSFVRLFTETLAGEYVVVWYLYELIPTSREDDRFGMIGQVLAFVWNGRYPERTFLPSQTITQNKLSRKRDEVPIEVEALGPVVPCLKTSLVILD
ncbi:hypothetical protein TNCV_3302501 [Trichonephila clavipes]|nr:hypothetical protein TNCV_3302501 [Trichonephila clavipes]